ncbi:MAG TPA: DUF167 domain-containing protein [Bacteroidia bacterium]|nr:DUF167 domain-containing protein [Bacteroidia bacterium]
MKLFIRVKPGKKKESITRGNNLWLVSINAPATDGKANERLVEFLSEILKIPKSKIVIQKGHTSPFKVLEITLQEEIVMSKLEK